ncbi:MAG: glycerol-3-phosphate dehydrogenase [Cohaesibacter sp.]|jgi:glycerol-3-phosphate dehydrogenase|nr:glycerol-3-phosphate dehydrogenase [Cohaesibacter sp.]
MTDTLVDVFVIGGGINGCGIARDAAGRGYSVTLAEMHDLASATSSASTKLIHGGLRYLEYYEFRLVHEALKEREVLLGNAPHIIWPLRFVLPHHKGLRPAWFLRLGLFMYDHLGGRKLLPGTKSVDMTSDAVGKPLKKLFTKGFEYSDCWVNDARLVVLNAMDARDKGATILTRTKVISAKQEDGVWHIVTQDQLSGEQAHHKARMVINAAGPWVDHILGEAMERPDAQNVRLVQGSHIIVPKLFEHDRCYIFQNQDGRIIFAIPYEEDFTLIGTTDQDYEKDLGKVEISEAEISYLCEAASEYFTNAITPDQVVWTYSGVRPLYDDGASAAQEATRDYVLKLEGEDGKKAPAIHIFGGKITTYRKLAEAASEKIAQVLGAKGAPWTRTASMPGGDFQPQDFEAKLASLLGDYPFLDKVHARRLMRLYGTYAWTLLGRAQSADDLGQHFGSDLYEAEVRYLMAAEWAVSAEDILYRRTKRGLHMNKEQEASLQAFLEHAHSEEKTGAGAPSATSHSA